MAAATHRNAKGKRPMDKGLMQRRLLAMGAALLMSSIAIGSAVMPAELSARPLGAAVYA